jgi:hypothetical protein
MPPMKFPRSGAGVAVLNQVSCEIFTQKMSLVINKFQFIYVVGGFDGRGQLSSVERFDTDNRVWETVKPMKISRSALTVNVIDGKLYSMVKKFIDL